MRKIVYHVASSVDNFIAREDGSVDGFIYEGEHVTDYMQSLQGYDTVLMGKNTYEFSYQSGIKPGEPAYPNMKHYIFSKTLNIDSSPNNQVEVIKENEIDFIKHLKASDGPPIYLCGGCIFASFLFEQNLIDELKIKMYPVLFGKGISIFKTRQEVKLSLFESKVYETGVILANYQICN
ncbi:dihydrofolate reductase family protein [Dyadobacter sp. CY347]|uniref:dihydrofolate reductase family protein n=1 Tax=Dyadobacter sp. CY347 TaxID=2909336 RepID=UPI001F44C34C|nr:dihydrofolate reductase family protein [Dyadobacter sp. CY347]MCF2491474.1 dihydrofolate reductase family protein [Dyadobacter sp. CY347]